MSLPTRHTLLPALLSLLLPILGTACPPTSGDTCTDSNIANEPANCGGCGIACAADEVCSTGQCRPACVAGSSACAGQCVDTQSDPDNCGACGETCASDEVCSAGSCQASCRGGSTVCGGRCVDTQVDPSNCGACGRGCAAGEVCSAGSCALQCADSATVCRGRCVDTAGDPDNCGACGRSCAAGEVCAAGSCALQCATGSTICDGRCVDTQNDVQNCGGCRALCPHINTNSVCVNGQCEIDSCSASAADCDGDAQNGCEFATSAFNQDANNCGGCGIVCPTGQDCQGGQCGCQPGFFWQGNSCEMSPIVTDPGFERTAFWQTDQGVVINTTATGHVTPGVAQWNGSAFCDGGQAQQGVYLPAMSGVDPLALNVTGWRVGGPQSCAARLRVELNGTKLGYAPSKWGPRSRFICLGERYYGVPMTLAFTPEGAAECGSCPAGSASAWLQVDDVSITPLAPGTCPQPETLLDGSFEDSNSGWTGSTGGGTYFMVGGLGNEGSVGANLIMYQGCDKPRIQTLIHPSMHATQNAIELWRAGTDGAVVDVSIAGQPAATFTATSSPGTQRLCLLAGHRGVVSELQLAAAVSESHSTQGLCYTPVDWSVRFDDVALVTEPSCPANASIIDPGFELGISAPALASSWVPFWQDGAGAEITDDTLTARSGRGALRLTTQRACRAASAQTSVIVPVSQGNEGAALTFYYRYGKQSTSASVTVGAETAVQLDATAGWTRQVVCLGNSGPRSVARAEFRIGDASASCDDLGREEVLWVDDIELTTDPSCAP